MLILTAQLALLLAPVLAQFSTTFPTLVYVQWIEKHARQVRMMGLCPWADDQAPKHPARQRENIIKTGKRSV